MLDEPVFPREIEEAIFSLAVQTDWSSAKNFILVAKRVHDWLIPQIYKVRVFGHRVPNTRPISDSRNLLHHGKWVRHIMLYSSAGMRTAYLYNRPGECLKWCPNALDVALWITSDQYDKALVDELLSRHLTHLSFDLGSFENFLPSCPDLSSPISFPHLTHLEVIGAPRSVTAQLFKHRFPALTHVALYIVIREIASLTADILKIFNPQLKVVIWYQGDSMDPHPIVLPKSQYYYLPPDDPRIVVLLYGDKYVRTWYDGTIGGLGLWRVAEEVIASRRVDSAS